LLEKAIVALQLVGHLAESGLPFQFKGGTSMLLLMDMPLRLSIDVDIVTQVRHEEFDDALDRIRELAPFSRIEHDAQRDRALPPKKHYRAYYPSHFPPPDGHIQLDVLFESAVPCESRVIRTPFIDVEREVNVTIPGVNGLLGDKLTAFAPTTIGILYNPDRAIDIVKQLFDVAVLFDLTTDLRKVATAYEAVHANQCRYRGSHTHDQTLDDTINACVALSQRDLRGAPRDDQNAELLLDGVNRLATYLINRNFSLYEARIAAGKAACASAWIRQRPEMAIESLRYDSTGVAELRNVDVSRWPPLSRLKGGNPEAFFYWWQAEQLLNGQG